MTRLRLSQFQGRNAPVARFAEPEGFCGRARIPAGHEVHEQAGRQFGSFPLDRGRGLGTDVVDDAVNAEQSAGYIASRNPRRRSNHAFS